MLKSEDIVDALIELKNIRHLTSYKISLKSDLPPSTVANVFQKRTMPQLDTLLSMCRGLEINPAQLFINNAKYEELTDDEREILKLWNGLDTERQELFKKLIYML